jgi:hypothetical protein
MQQSKPAHEQLTQYRDQLAADLHRVEQSVRDDARLCSASASSVAMLMQVVLIMSLLQDGAACVCTRKPAPCQSSCTFQHTAVKDNTAAQISAATLQAVEARPPPLCSPTLLHVLFCWCEHWCCPNRLLTLSQTTSTRSTRRLATSSRYACTPHSSRPDNMPCCDSRPVRTCCFSAFQMERWEP